MKVTTRDQLGEHSDLDVLEGYLWEPLWAGDSFLNFNHDLVVKYAGKA